MPNAAAPAPATPIVDEAVDAPAVTVNVALSILEKLHVPDGRCSSGLSANEYTLIPAEGVLE